MERPRGGCKRASYKVKCAASRLGHEYAIVKLKAEEGPRQPDQLKDILILDGRDREKSIYRRHLDRRLRGGTRGFDRLGNWRFSAHGLWPSSGSTENRAQD